jgi:hypothetical protein
LRASVVLFLILLLAWAPPALGAPGNTPSKPLAASLEGDAKTSYEAGKLLFADGDFAGALRKFERAHELSGDARLLWNMAVCEKNLRNYTQVRELVQRYLNEQGPRLAHRDKKEAQELLEAVTEFISTLTVDVDEPGAKVFVDDREIGVTPLEAPLELNIGQRRVRVEKAGFRSQTQEVTLSGGSNEAVRFSLEKQSARLILTSQGSEIRVDGKLLGKDRIETELRPGRHALRVTASGKKPHETELVLVDGETRQLTVDLDSDSNFWLWTGIVGGVVVASGVGVFFLTRSPGDAEGPTVDTTIGRVYLPLF